MAEITVPKNVDRNASQGTCAIKSLGKSLILTKRGPDTKYGQTEAKVLITPNHYGLLDPKIPMRTLLRVDSGTLKV